MTETADPAVDTIEQYLADLVAVARDVLGGNLIGAYAAGSVALGAYQPGRSDADVALVTAEPLSFEHKSQLVDRLRHESLPCPARGLELVVYWRAVAGSGAAEPGFEMELNTGAGMTFRATYGGTERAAADGRFWYGLDRSILREHGRSLFGPDPHQVFGEVTRSDVRQLLIESLEWSLAQPRPAGDDPAPGTEDDILGACRALVRTRNGYWMAKVASGRRLADSGFDADLITRAIAARTEDATSPGSAETRVFQQRVLDEITGSAG